jgi:hypothetical protein
MARRPGREQQEILSREGLRDMARQLAHLSEPAVIEVYQRAHRECTIINRGTFPTARSIQELVTAWKQLRKWRR